MTEETDLKMNDEFQIGDRVFIAVAGCVHGGKIQCFDDDFCGIEIDPGGLFYKKTEGDVFRNELDARACDALKALYANLKICSIEDVKNKFDQFMIDHYPEKLI